VACGLLPAPDVMMMKTKENIINGDEMKIEERWQLNTSR